MATALGHAIATPRAALGARPGRVRDPVPCPSATTCPGRGPASPGSTSCATRSSRWESSRQLSGPDVARAWRMLDDERVRQNGSHIRLTTGSTAPITSPCPTTGHRTLARSSAADSSPSPPPHGRGPTRSAPLVGDQPKGPGGHTCQLRPSAAKLSVPSSIARTCPGGRTAWNRRGLCIGRRGRRPACAPGCQECARLISTRRSRRSDASMRRLPCNLSARDSREGS